MLPTHAQVAETLQSHFPSLSSDVSFLWHHPHQRHYDPAGIRTSHIVLSVAPTPGFYALINNPFLEQPPLAFLHRPWTLDRAAMRRRVAVLSSHTGFDSALTMGWNTALAGRLGLGVEGAREFGGAGQVVQGDGEGRSVAVVAIMNAFHADVVDRVLDAARGQGWVVDGGEVLYLTGQTRLSGMAAAAEAGMPVLCVGHKACEEWGIRFLAGRLREKYPKLEVQEVYEEEEPRRKGEEKEMVEVWP
ncbi:hypothetical protein K490DRAFT_36149 [Saccharata proteae CBS 121410]|uniref:NGG1p interacting factor 3 n=1 Tax=Saccharata proteae CBS 121410 TaxID=1314787 RepID=A0A9P4I146_9PEZI|nr:hypothetical protein K490DRAFT_36149 [Saccharata proteae CBS 121410]